MKLVTIICLITITLTKKKKEFVKPARQAETYNQDEIKIHLIPHSHMDVGWLKTVEEYFYGANQKEQNANVQYIYDSVIRELIVDKNKTFTFVEMEFFKKWYNMQTKQIKSETKRLIENGQIEICNGGWVMNDEACTYYEDIIDQYTLGHQWLLDEFDYIPRTAYSIDPFGHSSINAALLSQMGINYLVLNRIHYQQKLARMSKKQMEFIWKPQLCIKLTFKSLQFLVSKQDESILTHLTYFHYTSPPQFQFDILKNDTIIYNSQPDEYDLPSNIINNLDNKCEYLQSYFQKQSTHYLGKNIFHLLGDDFSYQAARMNFYSFDQIISSRQFDIQYSTPQRYFSKLLQESVQFPNFKNDFFPYADYPDSYWTGYFTSKPNFKFNLVFIHQIGRYFVNLRTQLLTAMIKGETKSKGDITNSVQLFQRAIAILQHHDAITGTARKLVTDDYINKANYAKALFDEQWTTLLKNQIRNFNIEFIYQCEFKMCLKACGKLEEQLYEKGQALLIINNPGQASIRSVRIENFFKILKLSVQVQRVVDSQYYQIPSEIICLDNESKKCFLIFEDAFESQVNNQYLLVVSETFSNQLQPNKKASIFKLEGETITVKMKNRVAKFDLSYLVYENSFGSGAYIFKSLSSAIPYSPFKSNKYFIGEIVQAFHVTYYIQGNLTSTWIFYYPNLQENTIEILSNLDPISTTNQGREVVMRIRTNQANEKFYTDQNGLELIERPSTIAASHVHSNYYPITSMIQVRSDLRVTVMPDRPQGGTVYEDGTIELMLNRRLYIDDGKGLDEPLNEQSDDQKTGIRVVTTHLLIFNEMDNNDVERLAQLQRDQSPIIFIANVDKVDLTKIDSPSVQKYETSFLKTQLIYARKGKYLLRVHNMNERLTLDIDECIYIQQIFFFLELFMKMDWIRTTLSGNENWKSRQSNRLNQTNEEETENDELSLKPLQIKVFLLQEK